MSALQTTMDDLAATKSALQTTNTRLQGQEGHSSSMNSSLNVVQQHLQTTMDDLAATKTELQTTKTELQTTKTELQSTMDDLATIKLQTTKTRFQDQEGHSASMNSSLNVLQQQQQHCSSSLNALKTELASKTKNVAFSVHLTHGGQYADYVPVKFDGVHYNAGSGYKPSTGKFTAPVSGTYIFSTELDIGKSLLNTYIRILHSGTTVSAGWGHSTQDNHYITIPVTAITHVRQGEQVWVDSYNSVYLNTGQLSSHFVGALLSAD